MKKKGIIRGLIILLSSITAIVLVLTLRNTKTRLILYSCDKAATLDLGEYKVKDYVKNRSNGREYTISFYVDNKRDFYNSIIVKSKYYQEELDFDMKYYGFDNIVFAYGYFIIHNRLFNYWIGEESSFVSIAPCSGIFFTEDDSFLINYPVHDRLSVKNLNNEKEAWLYQELSEYYTNYEMVLKIAEHMPSYTKIEDDGVYVKGCYLDKDTNQDVLTDDYLIKIYEDENGIVKVGNVY